MKIRKHLTRWLLPIAIIAATLEISPYVLAPAILKHKFSRRDAKADLKVEGTKLQDNENQESAAPGEYLGDHILHPYLGFVSIPRSDYNEFCLPGTNPLTKKSDDTIHLVITGGSVAKDMYKAAGQRIIQNLQHSEKFSGKQFDIVVFALGGFKQPQQLMALNYFTALGGHYDIVINLDGFNEIVLPYSDNLPFSVFPSYPRHWNIYSRKKLDSRVELLMGKQAVLKSRIEENRIFMASSLLKYSNFALFIWRVAAFKRTGDLAALEPMIRKAIESSESDYQSTGIKTTVRDTLEFMKEQAEFWARSSLLMAKMAESEGFGYYHFLQPNQYVEGSKVLTREELEIAYESNDFNYKDAVRMGYPLLREQGRDLIAQGENFVDLTDLFIHEKRSVYSDKCCHFNQLGYEMIADRICESILKKQNPQ